MVSNLDLVKSEIKNRGKIKNLYPRRTKSQNLKVVRDRREYSTFSYSTDIYLHDQRGLWTPLRSANPCASAR